MFIFTYLGTIKLNLISLASNINALIRIYEKFWELLLVILSFINYTFSSHARILLENLFFSSKNFFILENFFSSQFLILLMF